MEATEPRGMRELQSMVRTQSREAMPQVQARIRGNKKGFRSRGYGPAG
jgi:hypothetical protein